MPKISENKFDELSYGEMLARKKYLEEKGLAVKIQPYFEGVLQVHSPVNQGIVDPNIDPRCRQYKYRISVEK